jgi:signal transduction histidine kinase
MRHFVLLPMYCLIQAGQAVESGALDTKMILCCHDEWQTLAHLFNQMTQKLQESLRCTQEQKIFFQAFLNAIPDGIRVINQNYQVVTANQTYHQQLGLPLTTHSTTRPDLPCYAASHARQHPCPPTQVTCPLHEIKKTGQPLKTTMEFMRMDGTRLQVEVCAAPMQIIKNGHTETFIVESVRDLTQTLQFSHEQKLASLGQLAAGVAHDIHNPLSSIRLALQSALRSLESATPNLSSINKYLKLTDKQIDKCIAVTRRLLKLAAPGSEHLQLVCLKEVITDTVSLLEFEAQERGIEIHTDFNSPKSRLLAIDSDMRMLTFNLLQNAFHAMPEGGYIEVQLRSRASNLQLSIRDSGVGIPPHLLNKIFEPFFSHRLNGKKGSGLGLAICKNIVERHHGRIEVSQTDQRGSQFIVTLPDVQHAQPLAKAG